MAQCPTGCAAARASHRRRFEWRARADKAAGERVVQQLSQRVLGERRPPRFVVEQLRVGHATGEHRQSRRELATVKRLRRELKSVKRALSEPT
eukprot:6212414-Pleurochrysis_carterae.AAC.2